MALPEPPQPSLHEDAPEDNNAGPDGAHEEMPTWAERTEQSYQVENYQDDNANVEYNEEEERLTARSSSTYTKASSLPSAAPEFYEEEPVTLNRIEEVLVMEHGLREACRTLPITMASWVFFILMIFYHGQAQGSFACGNTIKQSMETITAPAYEQIHLVGDGACLTDSGEDGVTTKINAKDRYECQWACTKSDTCRACEFCDTELAPDGEDACTLDSNCELHVEPISQTRELPGYRCWYKEESLRELRIGTITERYDILQWIHRGFVPAVTMPGLKHGQVRRTQQLLGKVRLAQTRSVPVKCDINNDLVGFYDGECHPKGGTPESFGTSEKTGKRANGRYFTWTYGPTLDTSFYFAPYTQSNEKNKFVAWVDIGRSLDILDQQFKSLKDFDWLDDNSQDATVEAIFLNPELNAYSKMVITFRMNRGGWIDQSVHVTPIRGDIYYHWAVIWMDVMWITIMLFLCIQAVQHAIEEIKRGLFWWWITDFFVLFDFLSLLGGTGIAVLFWYITTRVDAFVQGVSGLGSMPLENGIEAQEVWKTRYILKNWDYEKDVQAIFDEFTNLNALQEWFRLICLGYNLVIVCRFYRGFTGQPRIAVMLQTMSQVAMFMLHYLIVFVIVMANFIITGYILFGEQLEEWSSFGKATCSACLVLFGRFDYSDFHRVAPVSAALWFASFYILVCLVITGLTTATILHHYLSVRRKTGEAGQSIVKQVWQMIGEVCYGRTYDGAQKSLPPDRLFEMVIGETDPLRLRHLSRFNVDRRMRTRHEIHEAEVDPKVDVEFLIDRGMDPVTAERFLDRIAESGHHISMRSSPVHRLTLFIARQMTMLRFGAEHMRKKTTSKVEWASRSQDRVDLKHAKCMGLAKRISRAQSLPPGWSSHVDGHGRRYLRQDETGLTSWSLPKHLI
jgi:hypothetical protein